MTEHANGKAVKFQALAEKRVTRTLKGIRQIGNLSNRSAYDYEPDQVVQMFAAMRAEIDAAEKRFAERAPPPSFAFGPAQ